MAKIKVVAKRDFIESITTTSSPLNALCELIWNALDAGSNEIGVTIERDEMSGISSIIVRDNGTGINHAEIDSLFGSLGDSWKKKQRKINGRALHGKNGRGRFKAFSLGSRVVWKTIYKSGANFYAFTITGNVNTLDDFEVSDPVKLKTSENTGTIVTITNPQRNFRSLQNEDANYEITKVFCAYLTEYPGISINFDGTKINPEDAQSNKCEYDMSNFLLEDGSRIDAKLTVIEWNTPTERTVHLCDENGVSLQEIPVPKKVRAPGFSFTAYVNSDYFRELDKTNLLSLDQLHPGVNEVVQKASEKMKEHFRQRLSEKQGAAIQRWKKAKIYPYEEKADIGPIETAERQVFDIIAVNVEHFLPSFQRSDLKAKRFTFSLLAQALRNNPDSLQTILAEVLDLKKETQDDLAKLLKKTSLTSIISSSKIIANRLDFLKGLELLLFEKESKNKLLERDQLHKILEEEAWLFDEHFSLSGTEERLEEVLEKHLDKLGKREDDPAPVDVGEGAGGRVDLMLHKAVQPRAGEYDYLIVELKRPNKKINSDVLTQIEKYAIAVANDERFHGVKVRWTFMAISNELDDFARKRARQRGKPDGMVYDDDELNITVWARSWADVINDSRSKLSYLGDQLEYKATNDSAKEYLQSAHAKYIPEADVFSETQEEDLTSWATS